MAELIVEWDGRRQQFGDSRVVTVGRDPTSTVVCAGASVSRAHGRFEHRNGAWHYTDLGSRRGSHLNGAAVTRATVEARSSLRLGDPGTGTELQVSVGASVLEPTMPPPPDGGGDAHPRSPRNAPPHPPPTPPRRPGSDASLKLKVGTTSRDLQPGERVVIGRSAGAAVVVDNPLVGREHARISHDGTAWVIEDLQSKRGTWVDGAQIQRRSLSGATTVWLGPPDAGEKVVLVAPGATRVRATAGVRPWQLGAVAAALVLLVGLVAVAATNGGSSVDPVPKPTPGGSVETASEPDLEALKDATVLLQDPEQKWQGTGTIVSGDGMILTNSHVAAPSAPGQQILYGDPRTDPNYEYMTVSLTGADDEPAAATYRARLLTFDGYLDLAVLEIYSDETGVPVDQSTLRLPSVKIGDSDSVKSGDPLWVLGFPSVSQTTAISVTDGLVSSFAKDPRLSDVPRGWINSGASIRGGNSGGLAADRKGRIIGVPTRSVQPERDEQDQARPINLAKPLIEAAEAGAAYDPYTSVVALMGDEALTSSGWADPTIEHEGCDEGVRYGPGLEGAVAQFSFSGMSEGQELMFELIVDKTVVGLEQITWAADFPAEGCLPVTFAIDGTFPGGAQLSAVAYHGPSAVKAAEQSIVIER